MDKVKEEFNTWFSQFSGATVVQRIAAWEAWKASRESLCVELPENCKGMAMSVDEFHQQLNKAGVPHK